MDQNVLFIELPVEIINLILLRCDVPDICKLSNTCKHLHDIAKSEYVWHFKWLELSHKSGINFPTEYCNVNIDISVFPETSYFSRCQRLWCMLYKHANKPTIPNCWHCEQKSCSAHCLMRSERKIAIDMGSKTTWALTTTFALKRHPTVLVIGKEETDPVNADDDKREIQDKLFCALCKDRPHLFGGHFLVPQDPCSTVPYSFIPSDEFIDQSDHSDSEMIKKKGNSTSSAKASCSSASFDFSLASKSPLWAELKILLQNPESNFQVVSPLDCFSTGKDFDVATAFIKHVLSISHMVEEITKPNISLVICEPYNSSSLSRKVIATFLFNEMLVSRLCFLNKAYSVATLLDIDTCVVIDSGAHNTVVTLIVDGEVQVSQTQQRPVGGLTISEYLATAIKCSGSMANVNITNLDSRAVKSSCYLSYNITTEERRKVPIKHFVSIRCPREDDSTQDEVKKCELGAELYLAPEVMYAAMELPEIIKEMVDTLDPSLAKDVLRHILLTGSNTELNGFATRLIRDLQLSLPEYKHVINIHTYVGSRSWDAGMGATRITTPESSVPCIMQPEAWIPGSVMWITREDYVLYGTTHL